MKASLDDVQTQVNTFLNKFLTEQVTAAGAIHQDYATLWQEAKRVVLAGGKRLRPYLICLGYGELDERILPVAAGYELLHAALLAQDDVIDRDTLRHGAMTIHGHYQQLYRPFLNEKDSLHYAESAAFLGSNVLFASGQLLLAEATFPPAKLAEAQRLFFQAIVEVTGGELLDTEAPFRPLPAGPLLMYRYKTASYSCIRPLLVGAALSGRPEPDKQILEQYGLGLGLAFQLRDDYLGVFGNETVTGKSTAHDLQEGKKTYLLQQFLKRAKRPHKQALQQLVEGPDDVELLEQVRLCIQQSGAVEANDRLLRRYSSEALAAANRLSDTQLKADLVALVGQLVQREF